MTDLFSFEAPRPSTLIVFPMGHRKGRIRDVASKMLDKPTDRAATAYRNQGTDAILKSLVRLGISEREQDEHLGDFWEAVQSEMVRLTYGGHAGDGAA